MTEAEMVAAMRAAKDDRDTAGFQRWLIKGLLVGLLVVAIGWLQSALRSHEHVMTIAVGPNDTVMGVASATESTHATDLEIRHDLQHFIGDLRQSTTDVKTYNAVIHRAFAHIKSGSQAMTAIKAWGAMAGPLRAGKQVIIVKAEPALRVKGSGNSYVINWSETASDEHGNMLGMTHWHGAFLVVLGKRHMENIFGTYIVEATIEQI